MTSRRQQAEAAVERIARPILEDLGLELVEVLLTGPGKAPVLRITTDLPGGGITVDGLQEASRAVELALEVADVVPGRYRLEVSSPGLDRPWKTPRDFERHVGGRATLRLFAPLPDGRRNLPGRLDAVAAGAITFTPDGGEPLVLPLADVASARPEVDWAAILRAGKKGRPAGGEGAAP